MNRICDICDNPQFPSPSGWVCENEHGEAPWHPGEVLDYGEQYKKWSNKIETEILNAPVCP